MGIRPLAALSVPFLLLAVLVPAHAVTVVVNDSVLPAYPPPIESGGRILLPMRTIFEALGATVKWEEATQTAIGTRGDVTVRMTINSRVASINERQVTLDVPAQLISGSTYMPVRFPAEAFGAEVGWNAVSQTVSIRLGEASSQPPIQQPPTPPQPPVTPPPTPLTHPTTTPPPAPRPQAGSATGVVSAAEATRVVIEVDSELQVYAITGDTVILRQNAQAAATDLQVGDQAQVQHDGAGTAVLVRATFETATGKVLAKVPNQLLLDSRDGLLRVQPGVVVRTSRGAEATYAGVRVGDNVTVHLTPGTDRVFGIVVAAPAVVPAEPVTPVTPVTPTTPPPADVQIAAFYHDATEPLGVGGVLRVTLEGTPGGKATFDIGEARKGLAMKESSQRPGRYDGTFIVTKSLEAAGVPLVGHLEVSGRAAPVAQSSEPLTIDTVAPSITVFGPQQGEQTSSRQPQIAALVTDENGSGVDAERSAVTIRAQGKVQKATVKREGQLLSIVPDPLPVGPVEVTTDAFDRAGNQTERKWTFEVVGVGLAQAALAVTHDAAGRALAQGDTLTVTATGPAAGVASFSLGTWQEEVAMAEVPGQPGTYRAVLTVPAVPADRQETLSARLQTAAGAALTATAATPVQLGPVRVLTPVLVRPKAGAKVGNELVVEGATQPLAEVTCTISWRGRVLVVLEQTGQLAEVRVTADAHGHFQTEPIPVQVQSLIPASDITYTLSCVARSATDESVPVTVEFAK
jgi:hypothetical protein